MGTATNRVRPVVRPLRGLHRRRALQRGPRPVRRSVAPRHDLALGRHAGGRARAARRRRAGRARRGAARGRRGAPVRRQRRSPADPPARRRAHGRDRRALSSPTTCSSPPARSRRSTCSPRRSSIPGDVIITEGPTYVGALQAFSAYQPEIRCVPMDDDGMRMDLLEAELKRARAARREVHLHDPELPEPRRRHDVAGAPPPAARAGARVRHPGRRGRPLRAAALRRRPHEAAALARRRGHLPRHVLQDLRAGPAAWAGSPRPSRSSPRCCSSSRPPTCAARNFAQVTAERYFQGTRWRRTLQELTRTYAERRDAMLAALEEHFPPEARWTKPDGGFFVWVELPDVRRLRRRCSPRRSSAASPTRPATASTRTGAGKNCMRLAFCYAEPEAIAEGDSPARRGHRGPARTVPRVHRGRRAAGRTRKGRHEGEDRGPDGRTLARARGLARERAPRVRRARSRRLLRAARST